MSELEWPCNIIKWPPLFGLAGYYDGKSSLEAPSPVEGQLHSQRWLLLPRISVREEAFYGSNLVQGSFSQISTSSCIGI